MTTLTKPPATRIPTLFTWTIQVILAPIDLILQGNRALRAHHDFRQLDDRALADIGITRAERDATTFWSFFAP